MFWLSVMLSWKYRSHFSTSIFFFSLSLSFFLMSGVSEPALYLGQWNSTLYLPLDAANVSNVVCSMISIFLTSTGHVCTPLLLNTLVLKKKNSYWKRETESGMTTDIEFTVKVWFLSVNHVIWSTKLALLWKITVLFSLCWSALAKSVL